MADSRVRDGVTEIIADRIRDLMLEERLKAGNGVYAAAATCVIREILQIVVSGAKSHSVRSNGAPRAQDHRDALFRRQDVLTHLMPCTERAVVPVDVLASGPIEAGDQLRSPLPR